MRWRSCAESRVAPGDPPPDAQTDLSGSEARSAARSMSSSVRKSAPGPACVGSKMASACSASAGAPPGARCCDHRARALFLQDALHAANCIALAIEQHANRADELDVLRAVIAPSAHALHRADLAELCFPESQDMLGKIQRLGDFSNGAKCVLGLVHQALRRDIPSRRESQRRRNGDFRSNGGLVQKNDRAALFNRC